MAACPPALDSLLPRGYRRLPTFWFSDADAARADDGRRRATVGTARGRLPGIDPVDPAE
jgi:hypothetical protein